MSNAMTPQRNADSKCFLAKATKDTFKGKESNPYSRGAATSDDNQKFKDATPRGKRDLSSITNPKYKPFDDATRFKPNIAQDDTKVEGKSYNRESLTKAEIAKEQRNMHQLSFIPKRNEINLSFRKEEDIKDDVEDTSHFHEANTLASRNTKTKSTYKREFLPAIKPFDLENYHTSNSHFKEPAASEKCNHFLRGTCHKANETVELRSTPNEKGSQRELYGEREMKMEIAESSIIDVEPEDANNIL